MPFNFTLHATNPQLAEKTDSSEQLFTREQYVATFGGTEIAEELGDEVFGSDESRAVREYATLFDMSDDEAASVLSGIYTDNDFTTNKWTI